MRQLTPPLVGPSPLGRAKALTGGTGQIQDSAGRTQCYRQGTHVPCGTAPTQTADKDSGGGSTEKAKVKTKLSKEEKQRRAAEKWEQLLAAKTPQDAEAFRRAKADGISIPPAWTQVVYHGKDRDVLAEGRDAKGRKQRAENPAYRQRVSDANNARIARTLTPRIGVLRTQLRADAAGGSEEAKCLYLIALTGFRIGGKGDGKAKVQAFGASTLRGEHVRVEGDTVTFDFTGKKGVRQEHSVTDPVVAAFCRNAQPGQPLFKTRDDKVRAAWQEKYGGTKVHDIRHVVATEIAAREISLRIPPPPANKRERDRLIKDVATVAGEKLGNNPSQALGTYIDPRLWDRVKIGA